MSRYSLEKTYSNPDFWVGAAAVRVAGIVNDELRAARMLSRVEVISDKLKRGATIGEIDEFRDWLGPRRRERT